MPILFENGPAVLEKKIEMNNVYDDNDNDDDNNRHV